MNDFIYFDDRDSDHPFVEKVWRCRSDRGGQFLSVAASTFEIAFSHLKGKSYVTLRGPETVATIVDCPANGEWLCVRFKVGTFMPRFLPGELRDHHNITLPEATSRTFWLNGSAVAYPDFENAEVFVARLVREGILNRDRIVADMLQRRLPQLSTRSRQRQFLRSTGITYATHRQIERARYAASLLRDGAPILDVVARAKYFDHAHLNHSLRRFIGDQPTELIHRERQLSFLYKTADIQSDTIDRVQE